MVYLYLKLQSINLYKRPVGFSILQTYGRKPEKPGDGWVPFIVYFESRTRGICVGTLVSRMVVLTAAVCVAGDHDEQPDQRPINVVTGTHYRHPLRGIRVQVTRILLPTLPKDLEARRYLLQKSVALLLLYRKIPDILAEHPLRAIGIDYEGEDKLCPRNECIMIGWHFVYTKDKIRTMDWFQLHKHLRYQVLELADLEQCGEMVSQYRQAAEQLSHVGNFSEDDVMCFRDPDNIAQPCHGMYGAPLVCPRGRMVALAAAPAAQWPFCDRRSVLVHKLSSTRNRDLLRCAETLLDPEFLFNWELIPKSVTPKPASVNATTRGMTAALVDTTNTLEHQ